MEISSTINDPNTTVAAPPSLRRQRLKDNDRIESQGSQRKIAIAKDLDHIERNYCYIDWQYKSFADYVQGEKLSFNARTAKSRLPIAALDPEPFAYTNFSWKELGRIAALVKEGHDVQALIALALQDKKLPALRKEPDPDALRPGRLIKRILGAVGAVIELLVLLFSRVDGRQAQGDRFTQLDESMHRLVMLYLDKRGLSAQELFADARNIPRTDPEDGLKTRVGTAENDKKDEELGSKNGGPGESGSEPPPVKPPPPDPPPPDPPPPPPDPPPLLEDDLYTLMVQNAVRLTLTWIREEEKEPLEQLLAMVIAGEETIYLAPFVRVLFERAEDAGVPEEELKDWDEWLRLVARPDRDKHWGDAWNFFIYAQLPNFVRYLHALKGVDLSELAPEDVDCIRTAWDLWPQKMPSLPPLPEGLDPEEAAALGKILQFRKFIRRIALDFFVKYGKTKVSSKAMSIYWLGMQHYIGDLEKEARWLAAQGGDEELPEVPSWWEEEDA